MSSSLSGGLHQDGIPTLPVGTVVPASAVHFMIPGLLTRDQARNPDERTRHSMSPAESVREATMGLSAGVTFSTPARRDVPRTQRVARSNSYY